MAKKKDHEGWCCCNNSRFPSLAVILLIFAVVWLLNDLDVLSVNIPWVPVVLIVIAIGMIVNRLNR